MNINQPYIKKYSKDAVTPENPNGLTNPIGPEGYLHQFPSTREVKRMFKKQSLNCRSGRNYMQQVFFFRDTTNENKIIKDGSIPELELLDGEISGKYTFHQRTIEHKHNFLRNHTTGKKDQMIYYTPEELKELNKPKDDTNQTNQQKE